mgnify:CR=1 FL=1
MKSTITDEEIADAVTELKEKGSKVNSHSIRQLLGRGSYSTLNDRLAAYMSKMTEPFPDQLPGVPEAMHGVVTGCIENMWREALKLVYEKCEKAIQEAKSSSSTLAEWERTMAEDLDHLKDDLRAVQDKLLQEREQHEQERREDRETIARLRASEARASGEAAV